VHTRSEVSLKDEDTKFGTEINGDKIRGETRTMKNDEFTFKLGKSSIVFRYDCGSYNEWILLTYNMKDQMAPGRLHLLAQLERDENRQRSFGELSNSP
jgi:hypothetical protein